jgi:hypothetical protein
VHSVTALQKGFSHREEAKTTKIFKKKFKNPKIFLDFFRGNQDVFAVDSSVKSVYLPDFDHAKILP